MKRSAFFTFLIITLMFVFSLTARDQEVPQEIEDTEAGIEKVSEYYYDGSKKLEGLKKNDLNHGIWTEWYKSGAKKAEMEYEAGQKQGQWKEWYEDGVLKSRIDYHEDQLYGSWIEWHFNGRKKSQKYYNHGVPQGRWTEWDDSGNTTRVITHFDNGDKKVETTFEYTREGTIKTYNEWFENGNKRLEQHMKNGQWHRSYREWFETGGLAIETQYKEGKEDGVHRDYYENGNIRMEIEIQDGKKNGRMTFWNDQGLKQWVKVYLDDIYIRNEPVYEQNSP